MVVSVNTGWLLPVVLDVLAGRTNIAILSLVSPLKVSAGISNRPDRLGIKSKVQLVDEVLVPLTHEDCCWRLVEKISKSFAMGLKFGSPATCLL